MLWNYARYLRSFRAHISNGKQYPFCLAIERCLLLWTYANYPLENHCPPSPPLSHIRGKKLWEEEDGFDYSTCVLFSLSVKVFHSLYRIARIYAFFKLFSMVRIKSSLFVAFCCLYMCLVCCKYCITSFGVILILHPTWKCMADVVIVEHNVQNG